MTNKEGRGEADALIDGEPLLRVPDSSEEEVGLERGTLTRFDSVPCGKEGLGTSLTNKKGEDVADVLGDASSMSLSLEEEVELSDPLGVLLSLEEANGEDSSDLETIEEVELRLSEVGLDTLPLALGENDREEESDPNPVGEGVVDIVELSEVEFAALSSCPRKPEKFDFSTSA